MISLDPSHYLQDKARQAAEARLKRAAKFAELYASGRPLFSRRMGRGKSAELVRLTWPGVLTVYDPATGEVLAVSEPGKPDTLRA
jgi:hypothetical protein